MLNIVLVETEIAQNAGNAARTCAVCGARLHLVEPLGFRLTSKMMRRAGCDYWDKVEVIHWNSSDHFFEANAFEELHLFTGRTRRLYTELSYGSDAFLLFGKESAGLDERILEQFQDRCVRIPMKDGLRSLNLSNAVAIAAYEALRQGNFSGLV